MSCSCPARAADGTTARFTAMRQPATARSVPNRAPLSSGECEPSVPTTLSRGASKDRDPILLREPLLSIAFIGFPCAIWLHSERSGAWRRSASLIFQVTEAARLEADIREHSLVPARAPTPP